MSTAPEDRLRENLNRCLSDSLVKGFGGLVIGSVVTLLFFRRRIWPVWLGTGFGVGMAYRGCEKELNDVNFDQQKWSQAIGQWILRMHKYGLLSCVDLECGTIGVK